MEGNRKEGKEGKTERKKGEKERKEERKSLGNVAQCEGPEFTSLKPNQPNHLNLMVRKHQAGLPRRYFGTMFFKHAQGMKGKETRGEPEMVPVEEAGEDSRVRLLSLGVGPAQQLCCTAHTLVLGLGPGRDGDGHSVILG